ncbi:MAG TPA: glycosyltransferase [Actinobacteria bacterium]|nr:glycosyltransferase [Actinomycetota bacterium]
MKVVVLALNRGRGSGEIARQHASALHERGHAVTVVHAGPGTPIPGIEHREVRLHAPILPVHEYLPGAGTLQRPVAEMPATEALAYLDDYVTALDEATGPDTAILLGHHANITAAAVAEVARRRDLPYALFLHGTALEPRLLGGYPDEVWARIEAAVLGAAGILVTTEYVRDALVLPLIPVPRERFLVLPCGVDVDRFRPGRVDEVRSRYELGDPFVICPGAVTVLKGTHNVVEATKEYAELAETIFIGDGPLRPVLEARIGSRGRFLGYVSDDDRTWLINAASILTAAPEKLEHFGMIYVEALAGGTVPIAYEGGGVDSIVTEGLGILTERDPRALGRAIRDVLAEPERIEAYALAGRHAAVERYASERLGRRFVSWLEALAAYRTSTPTEQR